MQDFIDEKMEEVKLMADFDIEAERRLLELSVYDFYFHVFVKSENKRG